MYVAICDDDTTIHDNVKSYIEEFNIQNGLADVQINAFSSGEALLMFYSGDTPKPLDIIFMDIEMDELNGIDTIRKLQLKYNNLIIIFITSHTKYAPETFRVGAFQLIAKPISKSDFFSDYARALDTYKELHKEFLITWQGVKTVVEYKDIYYVEAYNRHLFIHTKARRYECIGKLSDYEEVLCLSGFVSIHQSFIVNMKYIKTINATDVLLKNRMTVYMSKHKRREVLAEFSKYITKG